MQKRVNSFIRHLLGWIFIALGIIGCFLPILQGVLFLFVGTIILAPEVPFFGRQLHRFRHRYPHIFQKARVMIRRSRKWMCKRFG